MIRTAFVAMCLLVSSPAWAEDAADHTAKVSTGDIKAEVASMMAAMTPGQTFMWR
ncbi:MAG: hypothetical protein JF615_12640, partial [Asticcacaulis sp.]|nr:hypothetical protein [Asticcacaulis sp.]